MGLAIALAGCVQGGIGDPDRHFAEYEASPPRGKTLTVCSGYGCKAKTEVRLSRDDLSRVGAVMQSVRRKDTPEAERLAIKKAIAWFETRTGGVAGTSADRPSIDAIGTGDATQMDCVDEATNTTSYLMVLAANGLLRHHEVVMPMAKSPLLQGQWTHYFAVMVDRKTGQRWAVDSSMSVNGREPVVMEAELWYART